MFTKAYVIFTVLNLIVLILYAMTSPNGCRADGCLGQIFIIFPALIGFISVFVFAIATLRKLSEFNAKNSYESFFRLITCVIFAFLYLFAFSHS